MTTLQVFSAVNGSLILQTEMPEMEDQFLQLKKQIFDATGVPNFCQQLMADSQLLPDWEAFCRCGQPSGLMVAFQLSTTSFSQQLLDSCAAGDEQQVNEILQEYQDPNVVDADGESPIVKVATRSKKHTEKWSNVV